ncbi:MAG: choice-of-anchor Q domain-containing protein [Gammaproteobacteria bacterium]
MIRFRVLLPILVAACIGMPSVLHAATISVTTFEDIVADGDDLCSIREAVLASGRADVIRSRSSALSQINSDKATLESQLPRLRTRPEETFSRVTLVSMMRTIAAELEAHESPDLVLLGDVNAFIDELDPDEGPLPPNPDLGKVEYAISLQERAVVVIESVLAALRAKDAADGCVDGSAFDVVLLAEGTYTLNAELPFDRRATLRGQGADKTVIRPAGASRRLFNVAANATLEVSGATLSGVTLGCADAGGGRGGALLVAGAARLDEVVLRDNVACDGGALYLLAEASATLAKVGFYNNEAIGNGGAIRAESSISLSESTFGAAGKGNRAGNAGGAIHFEPPVEAASLSIERSTFLHNEAGQKGSALHLGGPTLAVIENVTVGRNAAGIRAAVNVEITAPDDRLFLNNITLLENTSGSPATAGLYTSSTGIRVSNSLLAGNDNSDCDTSAVTGAMTPVELDAFDLRFTRNYYGAASGCPGQIVVGAEPEYLNYELDSGINPVGYLVQALGEGGFYVPVYPNDDTQVLLVNRGASTQDPNRCAELDQRSKDRLSFADTDCDIGAIEYQLGRRMDDVVNILVDQNVCIDVAANDIGDAAYVSGTLRVLDIERAGARAEVITADQVARCPNAEDISAADPMAARDVVLFTPTPGFRGETLLTYSLGWSTQGAQPVTGDVSGFARIFTESRGGITSSKLGGSVGVPALLLLALLAVRRRAGSLLALLLVCWSAGTVSANENVIYVNSGQDPFNAGAGVPELVAGDGKCTLREALNTARNDQANLTGGDCVNGNEGPDVIEFTPEESEPGYVVDTVDANGNPVVQLTISLNASVTSYGGITLRCPDRLAPNGNPYQCVIRPEVTTRKFSLVNSEGGISVSRMIFENGDAGTGNGGAINSRGSVSVYESFFRNNRARTGGVIFLRGVRSDLYIGHSTFSGNASTGNADDGVSVREGGGVVATSAGDEHRIQIESSTFTGNSSVTSAAALSLKTIRPVVVVNSTFSGNTSTAGAGALDVSDSSSVTLRNLTIVENVSGVGRAAIEAGARAPLLANSILAANYDTNGADANCSASAIASAFNLFGETAATCPLGAGTPVNSRREPAADVMLRLGPLQDNGGASWTRAPDPALEGPLVADRWIVDQGYNLDAESNLVWPLDTGKQQCASVDQRGISRESGGRCDIGAYEVLRVTALDDEASNIGRLDRDVVVDFLANDLFAPDATKRIRDDCVLDAPDYSSPGLIVVRDTAGNPCVEVRIIGSITPEQLVFLAGDSPDLEERHRTENPYVLKFMNTGRSLIAEDVPETLGYRVYTEDGDSSDEAVISLHVENIPPFARPEVDGRCDECASIRAAVGATVVIDVLANDVDYDNYDTGKPDPTTVSLTGGTCREEDDLDDFDGDGDTSDTYWQCQFGRVTIDPVTGVITWVPTNKFNPFTERFSYTVKDIEGKEATAAVEIIMARPVANGGGLLGEDDMSDVLGIDFLGGVGFGTLGFVGTLLLRRRRLSR